MDLVGPEQARGGASASKEMLCRVSQHPGPAQETLPGVCGLPKGWDHVKTTTSAPKTEEEEEDVLLMKSWEGCSRLFRPTGRGTQHPKSWFLRAFVALRRGNSNN